MSKTQSKIIREAIEPVLKDWDIFQGPFNELFTKEERTELMEELIEAIRPLMPQKKETPKINIYQVYEENIGPLTPLIADTIEDDLKEWPEEWFTEAIGLAVKANVRKWSYVQAIMRRWDTDGKDNGKGKQKKSEQSPLDALKERHQAELLKEAANVV